ncbi:MAG: hypothetical protein KC733_00675 [Candidatus Omnitrophica bacterium]|nr:hypothetical protein [Candidatus Omnitrophota bacterium]
MIKVKSTVQKTLKEQMKTDAWPLFWQECVGYAEKRFDQEIWFGVKGAKGGVPPDCKMGVDIVNLVIKKVLTGRRNCEPDVDFKAFFFRTIKSEISLLAKSKRNLNATSIEVLSDKSKKHYTLFDITESEFEEHNDFYNRYSDEFIESVLHNFLNFVRKDPLLAMITKIFIYSGVIFEECFAGIVQNERELVLHLTKLGYINREGEVQAKFWQLTNASQLILPAKFNHQQKMIFLIINQSLNIEKSREIASWLNLDVNVVYTMKQKMNRYIERFRDLFYKGEYDG